MDNNPSILLHVLIGTNDFERAIASTNRLVAQIAPPVNTNQAECNRSSTIDNQLYE